MKKRVFAVLATVVLVLGMSVTVIAGPNTPIMPQPPPCEGEGRATEPTAPYDDYTYNEVQP